MNWIFFLKRTIKSSVENNLHLRFLFHSSYPRRILKLYSIEISTLKRYPSCIYYPNPYLLSPSLRFEDLPLARTRASEGYTPMIAIDAYQ